MKTIQLLIDATGNLSILKDMEALKITLEQYVRTHKGEMIHQIDKGIPYIEGIFNKNDPVAFDVSLRKRIKELPEVLRIISLDIIQADTILKYDLTVESIYGRLSISG